jgi:hypothetical protein
MNIINYGTSLILADLWQDRAAALAAGDAKAAASALLRARRLIPARLAKAESWTFCVQTGGPMVMLVTLEGLQEVRADL